MKYFVVDRSASFNKNGDIDVEGFDRTFGIAPKCEYCGRYIDNKPWLPPFRAHINYSGVLPDGIYSRGHLFVSELVANVLSAATLNAVNFCSVELVYDKRLPAITEVKYVYILVPRSNAAIDVSASSFERGPILCPHCRTMTNVERVSKLVLEQDSWDGKDIFTARGLPGTTIVTERFRDVFESNRFGGLKFVPAEKYSFNHYKPLLDG